MTVTILASVSLFALISTARPLRRIGEDVQVFSQSSNYADAVQAVLKSGVKDVEEVEECLDCNENVQVRLASVDEVQVYLSSVDDETVKALVHPEEQSFHSPDEKDLLDVLQRLEPERGRQTPVSDEHIDALSLKWPSDILVSEERDFIPKKVNGVSVPHDAKSGGYSTPTLIIVGSCILSLLAVACVGLVVYILEVLKKNVLSSYVVWNALPNLEKQLGRRGATKPPALSSSGCHPQLINGEIPTNPEKSIENSTESNSHFPPPPPSLRKAASQLSMTTSEKSDGDVEEKYFDAESSANSSSFSTPFLPHLALLTLDEKASNINMQSYNERVTYEVQEGYHVPGGFPVRPSWSTRASEAKLRTVDPDSPSCNNGERRPYSAAPEFDAALAMQLRPGAGVGADAAWLVRFVMAVFGWCAILATGRRD